MEKRKKTFSVVTKAIFTIAFLAVFVINMKVIVQQDGKSGKLTLSNMKSYAQSGGDGGGGVTCPPYGSYGNCWNLVINENLNTCTCEYTGSQNDYCDLNDLNCCCYAS